MNEVFNINRLTKTELKQIDNIRNEMWSQFRNVSDKGFEIEYLGKKFMVHKNVFWPHEDSKPLVQNFTIKSGDTVLDVGTGTGVIAVFAAYKGAKKVVAIDINTSAIENAKVNAQMHGFSKIIDIRLSDMFRNVNTDEMFDVITANLPFTNKVATDLVESTMYDSNFHAWEELFDGVNIHLRKNGRLYISQANFGNVEEALSLAKNNGFNFRLIGENKMPDDPRIFYAFELIKK